MSKYNKTVLTQAGIDLAKRANAGQAKFKVTRAVTSADDFSGTPVQQLERMTEIPNIMQNGKILDAEEVESDNAVIGVSLRFTNEGLTSGYKIKIIGLYVQEDGQTNDFLYAVTTAVEPEYMPDFNDNVLYRFNTQLYLVIGRAQNVTVVVDDDTVVSIKKFNDFKKQMEDALKIKADLSSLDNFYTKKEVNDQIEQAGKVKKARINEGEIVEPDDQGVLNLLVDDVKLNDFPTVIADLNDLTTAGIYRFSNLTIPEARAIKNNPVIAPISKARSFIKVLEDVGNVVQVVVNVGDGSYVYVRVKIKATSTWTSWSCLNPSQMRDNDIQKLINDEITKLNINQYATKEELNNISNKVVNSVNGVKPDSNGNTTIDTVDNITVTTGFDWNTATPTNETRKSNNVWLVDQQVFSGAVERMNQNRDNANGRLSLAGGTMNKGATINWNGQGSTNLHEGNIGGLTWTGGTDSVQLFADNDADDNLDLVVQLGDDGSNGVIIRNASGNQVAKVDAAGNITSPTITALLKEITDLKNRLGEDEGRITHIENNYVEGRRFPASQEAQAQAWENEKPTRLAMIEK
ncbi:hypothetical protein [uncultured Lactobacillus sp.]|uniref:hypothetical protein n=1 Tax=uncultured Lactobacillus sp. TaxID=153152 RepID=UPI00263225F7|nr:hypothetical protein [uncultured Lactobacillus sp.]